jgi:metal-dependent hydrolase (beta-lactamase superfamily II)
METTSLLQIPDKVRHKAISLGDIGRAWLADLHQRIARYECLWTIKGWRARAQRRRSLRRKLRALDVEPVLSEVPIVIEGHAFTTGAVPRTSIEHVLPNSWVAFGVKDGLGCDTNAYMDHQFTADELAGKPEPDQHWHEHATCFNLGDRGLVIVSSCSHCGVINTLNRAREITKFTRWLVDFTLLPRQPTTCVRSWQS